MSAEKFDPYKKTDIRRPGAAMSARAWEEAGRSPGASEEFVIAIERVLARYGVQLDPSKRILELGSGEGHLLKVFKDKDLNAVGVDARPRSDFEVKQAQARVEQMPFADESFDVIVSDHLLEILAYDQYPAEMRQEIVRVLKKGGFYFANADDVDVIEMPGMTTLSDHAYGKNKRGLRVYRKD